MLNAGSRIDRLSRSSAEEVQRIFNDDTDSCTLAIDTMVNVPGRSKACSCCRRRRVTCGQQRPQCFQCQRLGRECPGYAKERIFIHARGSAGEIDKRQDLSTIRAVSDGSSSSSAVLNNLTDKDMDILEFGPESQRRLLSSTINFRPIYRQQLLQEFICSYLPKHELNPDSEIPWFVLFPSLTNPAIALDIALTAFCAASVGRARNDQILVFESLRYYTKGLYHLQKALWDPKLMYRDETLGAALSLAMYEILECPNNARSGYLTHYRGLARLVQLRGPTHQSMFGHRVFCTFRTIEILHALETHTHTFVAEPSWIEVPWRTIRKPIYEKVMDILAVIPALLEQADTILTLPLIDHARLVHTLIQEYWSLDHRLKALQHELEPHGGDAMYWPRLATMNNPADDDVLGKVFPVIYHFPDIRTANTFMLYWSAVAMVWSGLAGLYQYMSKQLSHDATAVALCECLPDVGERKHWGRMASQACQCVEYCIKEPTSGSALMSIVAPLGILGGYLETDLRYRREAEWVRGVHTAMAKRGLRLLEHL